MKKAFAILGILLIVGALFTVGTTAYASTSIEGFADVLQAAVDGLTAFFDFLIDLFNIVYP